MGSRNRREPKTYIRVSSGTYFAQSGLGQSGPMMLQIAHWVIWTVVDSAAKWVNGTDLCPTAGWGIGNDNCPNAQCVSSGTYFAQSGLGPSGPMMPQNANWVIGTDICPIAIRVNGTEFCSIRNWAIGNVHAPNRELENRGRCLPNRKLGQSQLSMSALSIHHFSTTFQTLIGPRPLPSRSLPRPFSL